MINQRISSLIFEAASKEIGTWEWAGADHNPAVLAYFAGAGHAGIDNDEVPWCAAFVGAVLAELGIQNTGSLLARSYLKWGEPVDLKDVVPGDVVVISRGSSSWQGHVGFVAKIDATHVHILGGNQGNQVNISKYDRDRVLGYRRAKQPRRAVTESKAVQTSGAGALTAVTGGVASVGALDGTAQLAALVVFGLIAALFLYLMRDRIKKWGEGIR